MYFDLVKLHDTNYIYKKDKYNFFYKSNNLQLQLLSVNTCYIVMVYGGNWYHFYSYIWKAKIPSKVNFIVTLFI